MGNHFAKGANVLMVVTIDLEVLYWIATIVMAGIMIWDRVHKS